MTLEAKIKEIEEIAKGSDYPEWTIELIRQAVQATLTAVREGVKPMEGVSIGGQTVDRQIGYNQCRSEVLEMLNHLK